MKLIFSNEMEDLDRIIQIRSVLGEFIETNVMIAQIISEYTRNYVTMYFRALTDSLGIKEAVIELKCFINKFID